MFLNSCQVLNSFNLHACCLCSRQKMVFELLLTWNSGGTASSSVSQWWLAYLVDWSWCDATYRGTHSNGSSATWNAFQHNIYTFWTKLIIHCLFHWAIITYSFIDVCEFCAIDCGCRQWTYLVSNRTNFLK